MFLLTAGTPVEPRWRSAAHYETWERDFLPHSAECVAIVARSHALGYPPGEQMKETMVPTSQALAWYDLERYLFGTVSKRFQEDGVLNAFDFFSIVIWKANRAKPRVAQLLVPHVAESPNPRAELEEAVKQLTRSLSEAADDPTRLRVLINGKFHLPIASAILAVLWPERFTVYDVRACNELKESTGKDFSYLGGITDLDRLWSGYEAYIQAVSESSDAPSLRDRDRVLWASNTMRQLHEDIGRGFKKP